MVVLGTCAVVWMFLSTSPTPSYVALHDNEPRSNRLLRALTVESNFDMLFSSSRHQHLHHGKANNASAHRPNVHRQRFAALNHIICEDRESMNFFYWRRNWQWHSCPYMHNKYEESLGRKVIPGKPIVPIFVIFNDKVTDLKEFFRSMHTEVQSSFQIVIIETMARIAEAIEFGDWLREHHVPVIYSRPLLNDPWALNSIAGTIDRYMVEYPDSNHYVVTDPDLSLRGTRENILEVFAEMLDTKKNFKAIAPALRIDDIPIDAYSNLNVWQGNKTLVDWEMQFWPEKMDSLYQESRKQRIYYTDSEFDTTFSMFRKGFRWYRGHYGPRVAAPYEVTHMDWYLSPTSGVPVDMVKYVCFNWSNAVTHASFPDCSTYLEKYNLTITPKRTIATDEKEAIFDGDRLEHVIGKHTPLHIKVGALPPDHKRLVFSKFGHHSHHSHSHGHVNHEQSSKGNATSKPQFWVEISPDLDSVMLTDHHFVVPFLAVPATNRNHGIVNSKIYVNRDVPKFDSLYPSDSNFAKTKEDFIQGFIGRCNRTEEEIRAKMASSKDQSSLASYEEDLKLIDKMKKSDQVDYYHYCFNPKRENKRRSLPLYFILDKLVRRFSIEVLDITSKGADASLLYSIDAQISHVKQIRCECQRGAWFHDNSVKNSCDDIIAYLKKYKFEVDYLKLRNCGFEAYELQATRKDP